MSVIMPASVVHFLQAAVQSGAMVPSCHYPQPEQWADWQNGFRYHGVTGEDLTASRDGTSLRLMVLTIPFLSTFDDKDRATGFVARLDDVSDNYSAVIAVTAL